MPILQEGPFAITASSPEHGKPKVNLLYLQDGAEEMGTKEVQQDETKWEQELSVVPPCGVLVKLSYTFASFKISNIFVLVIYIYIILFDKAVYCGYGMFCQYSITSVVFRKKVVDLVVLFISTTKLCVSNQIQLHFNAQAE